MENNWIDINDRLPDRENMCWCRLKTVHFQILEDTK